MEAIKTTTRIHPLMAAAAVSVIIVSLAGTAAITGMLPSSHSAPEGQAIAPATSPYGIQPTAAYAAPVAPMAAAPMAGAPMAGAPMAAPMVAAPVMAHAAMPAAAPVMVPAPAAYVQAAPAAPKPAPAPVVKKTVETRVVHHHHVSRPARSESPSPSYAPPPAQPAPSQPNYVGIATGAAIGGLIGNQIGGGNGKKLATVAGIIGGGMIGNEIANRNR